MPGPIAHQRGLCRIALDEVTDTETRHGLGSHGIGARLFDGSAIRGQAGADFQAFERGSGKHRHDGNKQQDGEKRRAVLGFGM